MEIKKMIFDFIYSNESNSRYVHIAIEKLVSIMMEDYIERQDNLVHVNYRMKTNVGFFEYDIYAPDGFDSYVGQTVIELKIARNRLIAKRILRDTVGRFATHETEAKNVIILVIGENVKNKDFSSLENNTRFKIDFWDVDNFVSICEKNKDLFIETYNNLSKYIIRDTVSKGIGREPQTYVDKRNQYIKQLNEEYHSDNLTLFLGAGASHDAKIATWESLISGLFVSLINKSFKTNGIQLTYEDEKELLQAVMNQNGYSPLLQTRFLRQGFEDDFEDLVRNILYKYAENTSNLLEEIGQLCIPLRGRFGIKAIVNYNFDDLVEKNLERLRVKARAIYSEGEKADSDELGIYHVHGFLPEDKGTYEHLSKSLLVFSEEGYHKLSLDPYNWANMIQLEFLTKSTCLFIGLSMTDPNLRRLLDIAAQKNNDDSCKHYALIKREKLKRIPTIGEKLLNFEQVNEELQESFFRELGVNIVWYDDHVEIPKLLETIKG
ncbi:SIR2 family protein [Enterococcus faecium]|uniref:SIR2 family protein n=2 Tax=unclassified Enterococcus TaxID=2608891 RepID=UPI000A356647|nr:SIR2 family protein [Enterococcus sp. 2F9_DIV0599]MBO0425859.1 SIR2 family protein [Enterococcus faecium]OTO37402.1 hypothetical protein A5871_001965 [Enterococcus sp. 2F9_DIV0599]